MQKVRRERRSVQDRVVSAAKLLVEATRFIQTLIALYHLFW